MNAAQGEPNSHNNEDRRDHDGLSPAAKDRVRDDGKSLVRDHVGQEEGHKQQVAILANGLYFIRVLALFPDKVLGTANTFTECTNGVPLMLNTLSWVSSKLI
jgi:hypothetical protein